MERHRLLQRLHALLRARQFSPASEAAYLHWARDFLDFFPGRDPRGMGGEELGEFLDHLRHARRYDGSALAEVSSAVALLLGQATGAESTQRVPADTPAYATPGRKLPGRREVVRLLTQTHGAPGLIAHLIYATGMRLGECLALRIADIDLETLHITICTATGEVDRIVPLPRGLAGDLHEQIRRVRATHRADLDAGGGHARPNALPPGRRKGGRSLAWQYVFPARRAAADPHTGLAGRHQLEPARVEREIAEAASRAGLSGTVDSQLLRQCFTLRMLEDGQDVETLRRLLGVEDPQRLIGRPRKHDGGEDIEEACPVYRNRLPAAAPATDCGSCPEPKRSREMG